MDGFRAFIPDFYAVSSGLYPVIPALYPVIPAKAGIQKAAGAVGMPASAVARFVRIRIFRIGGIFRISIRLDCAFRRNPKSAKTNTDERLPVEDARRGDGRILKIP